MRYIFAAAAILALATPALAQTATDNDAIFKAAGFKDAGVKYVRCEEDTTSSYLPGFIEMQDVNGDGVPEAWVHESSQVCFGDTAVAFVLVGKDKSGAWSKLLGAAGVAEVQATKTKDWPDIMVGGPGVGPMPPFKWNGVKYER
jgi:hypothetical protein